MPSQAQMVLPTQVGNIKLPLSTADRFAVLPHTRGDTCQSPSIGRVVAVHPHTREEPPQAHAAPGESAPSEWVRFNPRRVAASLCPHKDASDRLFLPLIPRNWY